MRSKGGGGLRVTLLTCFFARLKTTCDSVSRREARVEHTGAKRSASWPFSVVDGRINKDKWGNEGGQTRAAGKAEERA
jgi:hypothetical protein